VAGCSSWRRFTRRCERRLSTRIGVYGGTFDPIHVGHLAAAEAVRETQQLDRIVFVPNWQQPLKPNTPKASAAQRLAMVKLAVEDNARFAVCDIELHAKAPAYTIDTLDALRREAPDDRFQFIMGVDAVLQFALWRQPARILAEYEPIVMLRAGWRGPDWSALEAIHPDARRLAHVVEVPLLEVAAHELRDRVQAGRSVRYLVPERVRQFIEDNALYCLDA
jgi:nicotinate-nucleotide adenylyltransferase